MSAQQIFDYLEGRLTVAERTALERRLASEPALQKDLEAAREVADGFAALRNVAPPADLLDRTRRQIRAAGAVAVESPETRRAWSFPQWAWPVSAAVIVLIGGGLLFIREKSGGRNAPIASSAMPSSETAERADADATATPLAAGAPIAPAPPAAPAAGLAGLNESLARTAEKNLPAPTLASEKIDIPSPADELNARAEEVMRIVSAMGGTALKGDAPAGEERVLAYIPQEEIESFRKAVARISAVEGIPGRDLAMDKLTEAERDSTRRKLRQLDDRKSDGGKLAAAKRQPTNKEQAAEAPKESAGPASPREESQTRAATASTVAPASREPAPESKAMAFGGLAKKLTEPALPSKARGGGLAAAKQSGAKEEPGVAETNGVAAGDALKLADSNSYTGGTTVSAGKLHAEFPSKDEKSKNKSALEQPAATGFSSAIVDFEKQNAAEASGREKPDATRRQPRQLIEIIIHTAPPAN